MENSASDTRSEIFETILELISKDSILCNYVRYIDYGKFVNRDGYKLWETTGCSLNCDNVLNKNQIIRFVNNIDSKFFVSLSEHHCSAIRDSYAGKTHYGILSLLQIEHADNLKRHIENVDEAIDMDQNILERSINIDYTLKVKGLSLTLLDFIDNNIKGVRAEKELFSNILYFVNKLIFVGDKCHLLAITDAHENVYVSLKCLENIYKSDVDKCKEIILKLFKVINKVCIYFLNNSITQYINDMFVYPIIIDIYKKGILKTVDGRNNEIEITSLSNFSFCQNTETDQTIKLNIQNIIEKYTCNYLNNTCNIDSYDIPHLVRTLRENYAKAFKDKIQKSFMSGLNLQSICRSAGWNVVNDIKEEKISGYLDRNHVYIKKEMDMVPIQAFVHTDDGIVKRVLKDNALDTFKRNTGIYVKTIYLDVTTGTMRADARHPNVSGYSVCMGDLKGKVTFSDGSPEIIVNMLNECAALLTAINYTSPYNHDGEGYFKDDHYSYDFARINSSGEVVESPNGEPSVLENIKSYDDDEFVDEIEEEE